MLKSYLGFWSWYNKSLKVPKLFKMVACSLLSIDILIFLCHFVVKYRTEFLIAEISF